jgi:hypothetical protein
MPLAFKFAVHTNCEKKLKINSGLKLISSLFDPQIPIETGAHASHLKEKKFLGSCVTFFCGNMPV